MTRKTLLSLVSGVTLFVLVAALAWLTQGDTYPCAHPQGDISASVLAEDSDQEGLLTRAMILRTLCEPDNPSPNDEEP